jgi:prepilin-type N-terminal cleavage/methylation domain-containing protein
MKITPQRGARPSGAYTLPEVLCTVVIAAILFSTVYVGIAQGFAVIRLARENLRATQILQQYTEVIRLKTWDQIAQMPAESPSQPWPDYPGGTVGNQGITFIGTVRCEPSGMKDENYKDDHRLFTFTVRWQSGNVERVRQMTTLVSKWGMHNYVFGKTVQ